MTILRPWREDEIPIGAAIRIKNSKRKGIITGTREGLNNCFDSTLFQGVCSCSSALGDLEWSRDFGKTWEACGVIENS